MDVAAGRPMCINCQGTVVGSGGLPVGPIRSLIP